MLPNDTIAPHDWNKTGGVAKAAGTPEEYIKRLNVFAAINKFNEGKK